MAVRRTRVLTVALIISLTVTAILWWNYTAQRQEEEDVPFHMTLLVSGTVANSTEGNLSDVHLWVAVASGRPRPRWDGVSVLLEADGEGQALPPSQLEVRDQDANGRISQGDLLFIGGLEPYQMDGRVVLQRGGRTVGKVEL